jgi:hypothetical protein
MRLVIPQKPEVWSALELFDEIKSYIIRYVVLSQPEHARIIALWVMHTWVVDQFDFTPYLHVYSPTMQCGKTQLLRVVEPLVNKPMRACNISDAVLFRVVDADHPTLLWDEIDAVFGTKKATGDNDSKRSLLNAGFERGIPAFRLERINNVFAPVKFDAFCPKILSGIGRLPDTIVDRSIPIQMHRKTKNQSCQKFRRADKDKAKPIHDQIEKWSSSFLVKDFPEMPDGLSDRQEDVLEPLLAIADHIGGDVPELAREAAKTLCNADNNEIVFAAKQLQAIKNIIGNRDQISSSDLIQALWDADELPSRFLDDEEPNHKKIGLWLSKFIRTYGGKPARQLWINGQNLRGYTTSELKSIFNRYCS